jgi:hypothetical protein
MMHRTSTSTIFFLMHRVWTPLSRHGAYERRNNGAGGYEGGRHATSRGGRVVLRQREVGLDRVGDRGGNHANRPRIRIPRTGNHAGGIVCRGDITVKGRTSAHICRSIAKDGSKATNIQMAVPQTRYNVTMEVLTTSSTQGILGTVLLHYIT